MLVHACDRYRLLIPGFEAFFHRHWDDAVACTCYFATEEAEVEVRGMKNIRSGKGEWSDRLRELLLHHIREEYVLYFQEDMWLTHPVNARLLNALLRLAIDQGWNQVKLHSSGCYKILPSTFQVEGVPVGLLDNRASDFLMSHQVTLWKKETLLKQTLRSEHPWRHERNGTRRMRKQNPEIYHIDFFTANDSPGPAPLIPGGSGYQTVSVNGCFNHNVRPFLDILSDPDTPHLHAYADQLRRHLDQQLTHDGHPCPRKVDVFKKMKNGLKRWGTAAAVRFT